MTINTRNLRRPVLILALAVSLLAGCDREPSAEAVVTVAEQTVSADALLTIARAQGEPLTAQNLVRLARLTAEDLAAEQHLLAEGWEQDPDFIQARRRFIRAYVNARINQALAAQVSVSEADIAAYFTEHKARYGRPAQYRVALIELSAATHGDKAQPLATQLQAELAALPAGAMRGQRFNQLAAAHSSHLSSRYQGGDIGYLAITDSQWPQALRQAVFASDDAHALGQVATAEGVYVYRVLGKREPIEPQLADFREQIRRQLLAEKSDEMRRQGRQRMLDGVAIQINEPVIERIASGEKTAPVLPASLPAG